MEPPHRRGVILCTMLFVEAALVVSGLFLQAVPVAEAPTPITWRDNAVALRGRHGTRVRYACPPGGEPGTVWGTNLYTDDSSICGAAAHAGRITRAAGGVVVVHVLPGYQAYRGSARNDVTSLDYGEFPGSFTFEGIDPALADMMANAPARDVLGGAANAIRYRGRNGLVVTVRCPAGVEPGTVWGSGPYTDDSSICGAGIHAGVLGAANGGSFVIRIEPGRPRYRGSERHGLTSEDWGEFPGSFSVRRR